MACGAEDIVSATSSAIKNDIVGMGVCIRNTLINVDTTNTKTWRVSMSMAERIRRSRYEYRRRAHSERNEL
jgi:hypothetical protein